MQFSIARIFFCSYDLNTFFSIYQFFFIKVIGDIEEVNISTPASSLITQRLKKNIIINKIQHIYNQKLNLSTTTQLKYNFTCLLSLQQSPFHPGLHSPSHLPVNLSQGLVSSQLTLHCLLQFVPKQPAGHPTTPFTKVSIYCE